MLLNKNHKIIFIVIFFSCSVIFSQTATIKIVGSKHNASLLQLEGEKTNEIDSLFAVNDIFTFSMKDKQSGFYRLQFDSKHFINFVNDGKDIEIITDFNYISDSLKVIKSESNKLYYQFIKLNKSFKTKTELLNVILQRYPKDDDFYEITLKKFEKLKYDYSI